MSSLVSTKSLCYSHAIYCVRNIVDHYVSHGSTVNVCATDIAKAFDRVNHDLFTLVANGAGKLAWYLLYLRHLEFCLFVYVLVKFWCSSGWGPIQWRRNEFESEGDRSRAKVRGNDPARSAGIFFVVPLHHLAIKAQLVVLVSAFVNRDGQYSLVSLLFAVLLLTVPPVPHGVGATGPIPLLHTDVSVRACNSCRPFLITNKSCWILLLSTVSYRKYLF